MATAFSKSKMRCSGFGSFLHFQTFNKTRCMIKLPVYCASYRKYVFIRSFSNAQYVFIRSFSNAQRLGQKMSKDTHEQESEINQSFNNEHWHISERPILNKIYYQIEKIGIHVDQPIPSEKKITVGDYSDDNVQKSDGQPTDHQIKFMESLGQKMNEGEGKDEGNSIQPFEEVKSWDNIYWHNVKEGSHLQEIYNKIKEFGYKVDLPRTSHNNITIVDYMPYMDTELKKQNQEIDIDENVKKEGIVDETDYEFETSVEQKMNNEEKIIEENVVQHSQENEYFNNNNLQVKEQTELKKVYNKMKKFDENLKKMNFVKSNHERGMDENLKMKTTVLKTISMALGNMNRLMEKLYKEFVSLQALIDKTYPKRLTNGRKEMETPEKTGYLEHQKHILGNRNNEKENTTVEKDSNKKEKNIEMDKKDDKGFKKGYFKKNESSLRTVGKNENITGKQLSQKDTKMDKIFRSSKFIAEKDGKRDEKQSIQAEKDGKRDEKQSTPAEKDSKRDKKQSTPAEKNGKRDEKQSAIAKKDGERDEKQSTQAEKDGKRDEKQRTPAEKDGKRDEKQSTPAEKNGKRDEKQSAIAEKDGKRDEKQSTPAEKGGKRDKKQSTPAEKNGKRDEKQSAIAKKDDKRDEKQRTPAEKDGKRNEKQSTPAEKDGKRDEKQSTPAEKDGKRDEKQSTPAEKDGKREEKQSGKAFKENKRNDIVVKKKNSLIKSLGRDGISVSEIQNIILKYIKKQEIVDLMISLKYLKPLKRSLYQLKESFVEEHKIMFGFLWRLKHKMSVPYDFAFDKNSYSSNTKSFIFNCDKYEEEKNQVKWPSEDLTALSNKDKLKTSSEVLKESEFDFSDNEEVENKVRQSSELLEDIESDFSDSKEIGVKVGQSFEVLEKIESEFSESEKVGGKIGQKSSEVLEDKSEFLESSEMLEEDEGEFSDIEEDREEIEIWESPVPLTHGEKGVFDVNELVELVKGEKAVDVCVIKLPKESPLADYMVIVSAMSSRHLKAMFHTVNWVYKRRKSKNESFLNIRVKHINDWIAVHLGNIVLHLFLPETREKYDLETLWTVGPEYDDHSRNEITEGLYMLSKSDMEWLAQLDKSSPSSKSRKK